MNLDELRNLNLRNVGSWPLLPKVLFLMGIVAVIVVYAFGHGQPKTRLNYLQLGTLYKINIAALGWNPYMISVAHDGDYAHLFHIRIFSNTNNGQFLQWQYTDVYQTPQPSVDTRKFFL